VLHVVSLGCSLLASASSDTTIKIWDHTDGRCLSTLDGHVGAVRCIAGLATGLLVSGSDDKTVRLWDLTTGICLLTMLDHVASVLSISVLCTNCVVTSSEDCSLKLWKLEEVENLDSGVCRDNLFSAKGVHEIGDEGSPVVEVTLSCFCTLTGHKNAVQSVATLDQRRIASGSTDSVVKVWDTGPGCCLVTLNAHHGSVLCVAMLNCDMLASCSEDGTLKIWSLPEIEDSVTLAV